MPSANSHLHYKLGLQLAALHCKATQHLCLQVNLFIAVLKIKFAKAQTLFHSKLAKLSRKKRKNILGRVMDKGKKRIKDQVDKQRQAGEVTLTEVIMQLRCSLVCHFPCIA